MVVKEICNMKSKRQSKRDKQYEESALAACVACGGIVIIVLYHVINQIIVNL